MLSTDDGKCWSRNSWWFHGLETRHVVVLDPVTRPVVDDRVLETGAYPLEVGTESDLVCGALVADADGVTGADPTGRAAVDADYERYRELVGGSLERLLERDVSVPV